MAQNLLSVITLPSAPASNFNTLGTPITGAAGDKIYTYWDDSTSAIVSKIEKNTSGVGSNLGAWGDSGDFETAESNWINSENEKGIIAGYLTRSSTVSHAGTYSAKLISPSTLYTRLIHQYATLVFGQIYNVSCWVYIPSGTPLASSGNIIFTTSPISSLYVSNVTSATIADCTDTWFQITGKISTLDITNPSVTISLSGGTPITNGVIYFDEFYIYEDTGYTSVTTTLTDGPLLPDFTSADINTNGGTIDVGRWWSGYSICSGTTLLNFRDYLVASQYPYAQKQETPNHAACSTTRCEISWDFASFTITPASSQFDSDGAFTVLAVSNRVTFGYAIATDRPVYGQPEIQTSGTFSNLSPGTYKVWAVADLQCATSTTITVPYDISNTPQPTTTNTYTEKYRMEYLDFLNEVTSRVSIWQRNYNGSVVEVQGGPTPFIRTLSSSDINDKFDPIRRSNAQVTLVNTRDLQFIGLFSQDDRKYQVRYSRGGSEKWRGLIVPSVFSEPYNEYPPYLTTIYFTDGLVELDSEDFLDRDGNPYQGKLSLIKIVANILSKLDLALSIRVAANIIEDSHNQTDKKPFEETLYDMEGFYSDDGSLWDCSRVLKSILQPFGAKLVQEDGYWNIIRVEEQTATYNTRIYDADGTFNTTGTKDPILAVSNPTLRINSALMGDQTLEITPAYGKITINHKLFPKVSLLKGYSFQDNDEHTLDWDNTNQSFRGWSVDKSNGLGVIVTKSGAITYQSGGDVIGGGSLQTITTVNELEGKKSAIQFTNLDGDAATGGRSVILNADRVRVQFSQADSFTFSFNYQINTNKIFGNAEIENLRDYYGVPPWVRIGYRIKSGSLYYSTVDGWGGAASEWNYIWASTYDKTENFKIDKFEVPGFWNFAVTNSFDVSLWIEGVSASSAQSQAELEAITTTDKETGYKIKALSAGNHYYYELVNGTETPSFPTIVQPGDYDLTNNECYWNLVTSFSVDALRVSAILIDEVIFNIYPNSESIPESEKLTQVINGNYKEKLEVDLEGGDVTADAMNSKQYIYNNKFLDQNEGYTDTWTRTAVSTEATTIQAILLKSLVNQYRWPTFKFSGSLIGFTDFGFLTTIKHTQTAASLSLSNEEFTGSSTGWSNTGSGTSWAYDSNDVQVTLSGATNSKYFGQSLAGYSGQRVSLEWSITRSATSGIRGDWFVCVLLSGGAVVQEVVLENNMIFDSTYTDLLRISFDNDFDTIAFYVRNISGTGDATYDVDFFRLVPQNIVRYYTPNSMSINDKMNEYTGEWAQLVPVVFSSDPTIEDSGEGNTDSEGGAGRSGGGSGGDFNNDFNGDFNI